MSNPAAVVGKPAIQSAPIIPPRRVGRGSGWMRPRGPPCAALVRTSLASAYVFGHVDVLADPERQAPHERAGLASGSPEAASERSVMARP